MYLYYYLFCFLNVSNAPTYYCHAPPTPGRAWVGIIGDLQESFNKFPTPGDNFMLQVPYILYRHSRNNENSWTNAPTLGDKIC